VLGLAGSVALTACVAPPGGQVSYAPAPGPSGQTAYGENYAPREPPPMRYEARPDAPPSGRADTAYWVDGRWRWDGQEFGWVPGHYQDAPRRVATWQAGHWERDRAGWTYIDGRWS
jgi:WXXGXW repeat (2 copies)